MIALSVLVLLATIIAIVRRHDVRLVLLAAGAACALLAGNPLLAFDTFAAAMVATLVAPICASMGFAAILAATGCDRALARLLLHPIARWPWLALPGTVVAACVTNLAIPSQAATAAVLGPIALPLLQAARLRTEMAAAALLLGASFGGDLLSPGAQDLLAIANVAPIDAVRTHRLLLPAIVAGVATTALLLTLRARRRGAVAGSGPATVPPVATAGGRWRALVPLLPVALLLAAHAQAPWTTWLLDVPVGSAWTGQAGSLAVVRAMLLGAVLAAATAPRALAHGAATFFRGMGDAYASVIALTICAQVFGAGLAATGLSQALLASATADPAQPLLPTLSALFPGALALLSGSGSGSVLAFAQTFLIQQPAGAPLDGCAALACLGAAFGRTASPVAAVTICTAGLARVDPIVLVRAAALPLLGGALVACGLLWSNAFR